MPSKQFLFLLKKIFQFKKKKYSSEGHTQRKKWPLGPAVPRKTYQCPYGVNKKLEAQDGPHAAVPWQVTGETPASILVTIYLQAKPSQGHPALAPRAPVLAQYCRGGIFSRDGNCCHCLCPREALTFLMEPGRGRHISTKSKRDF